MQNTVGTPTAPAYRKGLSHLDAEVVFFASSAYKSTPEAENAAKKTHKKRNLRDLSRKFLQKTALTIMFLIVKAVISYSIIRVFFVRR